MRKTLCSLAMMAGTVLYLCITLLNSAEKPVEARIVTVQRGDVHQVVALSGRLAYSEEAVLCAPTNASIARILVAPGQRVAEGEALVRFSAYVPDTAISVVSEYQEVMAELLQHDEMKNVLFAEENVLRSQQPYTVRQVLVEENLPVSAGTPLVRLTSNEQRIVCGAVRTDADKIKSGMWAWIESEGEDVGFAEVVDVGELEADPHTGLTGADIMLRPEQHLELPEGALINVDVFLAGSDDVLTLPVEAITERNTVWWVNEGRCTEIPAEIVMTDEIHAWVALPEGIRVAVGEFKEGQSVAEASP